MLFYKPTIRRGDMQSVLMSMADEAIGTGERYEAFKKDFGQFLNFNNIEVLRSFPTCIVSSFLALGLSQGDSVLMSVFESPLALAVAEQVGLDVILCDVDMQTGLIDKKAALDKIKASKPKAVYLSSPVAIIDDLDFYKKEKLKIVYDISNLVGMTKALGSAVDVAVCSLESDMIISSAGGGCFLSNSYPAPDVMFEEKLSDLNTSLAQMQLECYYLFLERRKIIRIDYIRGFEVSRKDSKNRVFSFVDNEGDDNCFVFSIFLDSPKDALSVFARKKIPTKPTFSSTIFEKLKDKDNYNNASYLYKRVYSVPLYYFLKPDEIELIRKVLAVLP